MADDDPQRVWEDYYNRIKRRRLAAAAQLWAEIAAAGATEETVFALDFAHFANSRDDADKLALQLSEHYTIEVSARDEPNYWNIKGSTRPEGICLTKGEHLAWVEFMVDVARSYACVFSEWTLDSPALGKTFRSPHLDSD